MINGQRYEPQKVSSVDVDGTLLVNGELDHAVMGVCIDKRASGYKVYLWSARGEEYAKRFALQFGVEHHFDAILSKPGILIDEKGWSWAKFTKVINLSELRKRGEKEAKND